MGPQEWLWGSAAPAPIIIFGDASEPGDHTKPWICAAILQRPDQQTLYFGVAVPDHLLAAFKRRSKQICVLKLLWVVLPFIVWPCLLRGAYVVIYEDNASARSGIVKGMPSHRDINAFVALLWGSAAELHCAIWAERIASSDNLANRLTRPGLDSRHLCGAIDVAAKVDWRQVFHRLEAILERQTLPVWQDVIDVVRMSLAAQCQ